VHSVLAYHTGKWGSNPLVRYIIAQTTFVLWAVYNVAVNTYNNINVGLENSLRITKQFILFTVIVGIWLLRYIAYVLLNQRPKTSMNWVTMKVTYCYNNTYF